MEMNKKIKVIFVVYLLAFFLSSFFVYLIFFMFFFSFFVRLTMQMMTVCWLVFIRTFNKTREENHERLGSEGTVGRRRFNVCQD